MIVTARAVTSTTNITGLRAWMRGSNLRIDSTSAPFTIRLSHSAVAFRSAIEIHSLLVELAVQHHEVLDDRAQRVGREEGERRDNKDHANQQQHENRAVGRESTGARRH